MKTIEQLLELTKNPFYKLSSAEKAVLDDFLSKRQEEDSTLSPNKNSKDSEKSTHVRVRNIVPRVIPSPQDAPE